jgi:hypothetical protein
MTTIQDALNEFKSLIENAIIEGGDQAKTAIIRSSKPILAIHEAIKTQLVDSGVNKVLITPAINSRKDELKLSGFLKQKNQDICVRPKYIDKKSEIMEIGLLNGITDDYGKEFTRHTLAINVRSQISSIQKNFDTLFERTVMEAYNLHERCNDMVLGEVYMIAIPEYDDKEFKNKKVAFKPLNKKIVEKYIKSFQSITNRQSIDNKNFQYEVTCLLIVNFKENPPKLYHKTQELIQDELLPKNSNTIYEGLEWEEFSKKLLGTYESRFGKDKFT